jgi:hypothetical protein
MQPGPKKNEWQGDWLAVSYFVIRAFHNHPRWGFEQISDYVFDMYNWRLTRREFEVIQRAKKDLLEFRTKRRKLLSYLKVTTVPVETPERPTGTVIYSRPGEEILKES